MHGTEFQIEYSSFLTTQWNESVEQRTSNALRHVVCRDANRCEDTGGPQALLLTFLALRVLLHRLQDLRREFRFGDQLCQQGEDYDSHEKLYGAHMSVTSPHQAQHKERKKNC